MSQELRELLTFSEGLEWKITVTTETASKIGHYMNAVGRSLKTNDFEALDEFKGVEIEDHEGQHYTLETRPNTIHRLIGSATETFEDVYRLIT